MLGSFNNWDIIQFTNKTTSSEYFDAVHKVLFYGISDNMASLLQLSKYGDINAEDTTTMVYYVINYLSEPYTLLEGPDSFSASSTIHTLKYFVAYFNLYLYPDYD